MTSCVIESFLNLGMDVQNKKICKEPDIAGSSQDLCGLSWKAKQEQTYSAVCWGV